MPAFYYPKLVAYRLAMDFAVAADELSLNLPRSHYHVADQLRRSALSVPLNIAEGSASYSYKTRLKHYGVANGSAAECNAIFEFITRRNLLPSEQLPVEQIERIGAVISGSLRRRK